MKKKILPIISVVAVVYSAVSIGYTALPIELQEMLPYFNEMVAWVTGGSSGAIGAVLMYVDSKLKSNEKLNDEKVNAAIEKTLELVGAYKEVKGEIGSLKSVCNELIAEIKRVADLNETALKVKLENTLISQKAREIIEGVLNEK